MQVLQVTTNPTLISAEGQSGLHILYNDSDTTIYLALDGDAAVTTATGYPLKAGRDLFWHPQRGADSAIYAIHGGVGNKALRYGRAR